MCGCGKPTINGEPGAYSWDGKHFSTRAPYAPELGKHDEMLYDLPGRCGRGDSHCHHIRVVKGLGGYAMLVRHGGGQERFQLGYSDHIIAPLAAMDDDGRYWFLVALHHAHADALRAAIARTRHEWAQAFVDKRIKVQRRNKQRHVMIVEKTATAPLTSPADAS